jgi:iron complex outermembrane receptor protein
MAKFRLLRFIGTAGALLLAGAALEAPAPALAADVASEEPNALEEIVVTARRREENLQNTPVSVTALSEQRLRDLDVQDISQLSAHVPNLNLISSTSFSGSSTAYAFIRGIGQQDVFVQNDPGVGIYIDGVYVGRSQGAVFDVVDLQRVEVLRGPQGTLYGRNTIGGAINLVTEPPSATPTGYADIEGGSYGTLNGKAKISGPIGADLYGSLAIARVSHDGFVKAKPDPDCPACTREPMSNEDTWAVRGALRYQPIDSLTFDLGADYSLRHNRAIGSRLAYYGAFDLPNPCPGDPDAYDCAVRTHWNGRSAASFVDLTPNTSQSSEPGWDYQRSGGVNLTGTYTGEALTFKSITAYRRALINDGGDNDGSPLAQSYLVGELTDQWQASQEFQVSSSSFEKKLDWIIGVFGMREDAANVIIQSQQFAEMSIIPPFSPPLGLPFPLAVPSTCFNAAAPPLFGCGLLNGTSGESDTTYRVHTEAAYANAVFHLTRQLSLSAGLRYNVDTKYFRYTNASTFPPQFFDLHNTWYSTTPRVGVEFQATPDVLFYTSWSRGYKSGTFNNGTDPSYPVTVKPEKVSAYEVGTKTQWLDHRVTANLALFYTQYSDMQLQVQTNFALQYRAWTNVGDATIKGFELELTARPVNHLELTASVGNTASRIHNVNPIALYGGSNPNGVVADGARLEHTPLFSTDLGAVLDFPVANKGTLALRADWSAKSSQEGDLLNSAVARVAGYNVTNVRLSFAPFSQAWELYVLSNNVLDRQYEAARYSFSPSLVAGAVDGPPRVVAGGARVRF